MNPCHSHWGTQALRVLKHGSTVKFERIIATCRLRRTFLKCNTFQTSLDTCMFCLLLVESGFSGSRISVGISSGQQQRLCKKSSTGASLPRPRKQTASKEQKQNTNGGDWFDELFSMGSRPKPKKKAKGVQKRQPSV